jgi:hypothetical protein
MLNIRALDEFDMAISMTKGLSSSQGTPIARGLLPMSLVNPPHGAMIGGEFAPAIPIILSRHAIRT